MPAKKDQVVRTRYVCPTTGRPKFLQTFVKLHASREAAKAFLDKRKKEILAKGKDSSKVEDVEEVKPEVKPDVEEVKPEVITKQVIEVDNIDGERDSDLMNMVIESTPIIDKIFNELVYSPFKLNMNITKTGYSVTILGSTKSGKSYLLERLLKKYVTNQKSICIMSAPNAHNEIYKNYPKDILFTDYYDPKLVKAGALINKKMKNKFPICYVLDDVITAKNDKKLEDAYLTLRNSLVSIIVLIQNIQLLKSTSRSNSNILIFKKFNSPHAVSEYVMKQFLGSLGPFADLRMEDKVTLYMKIMNDGNYNFFVLDTLENTLILCKGTDI